MAATDDLTSAINNVAAQLNALTVSPKPTYSVGGRSISWTEHFSTLTQQLKGLQDALVMLGGPFEIRSRGM